MNLLKKPYKYVIKHTEPDAYHLLADSIIQVLNGYAYQHWIILCIGTDRSTGDALGPLIGSKLKRIDSDYFKVFGTLEEPVHALNLRDTIQQIKDTYAQSGIIAVDASLGKMNSVGTIQIVDGPLKPGAGVHKELPEIGHFHITGIVNVGGFMEYFVLQNTRLYLVMEMADIISLALSKSMKTNEYKKENAITV